MGVLGSVGGGDGPAPGIQDSRRASEIFLCVQFCTAATSGGLSFASVSFLLHSSQPGRQRSQPGRQESLQPSNNRATANHYWLLFPAEDEHCIVAEGSQCWSSIRD